MRCHHLRAPPGPPAAPRRAARRAAAAPRAAAAAAAAASSRAAALRALLARPGILLGPAAYDGLSARLTEEAGFDYAFMSGFSVAAARLGAPDTGLLSYAEVLDQGRGMLEATRSLPLIGDADTGYGNAMNVQRTVRGFAAAGFAGVLIEDQAWPKSCGHVRGKRVVGRQEAVARVRAAADARDAAAASSQDRVVLVARTDARQAASLEEALWRAAAFADAGADVVFVDALASEAEMRTLCASTAGVHKMANMLEGGGKTPVLPPAALEALGFKLVAYPLSLLGAAVAAQRRVLAGLLAGRAPEPPEIPTFEELQAVVGFPRYFEEERRYAVPAEPILGGGGESGSGSGSGGGSSAFSGGAAAAPAAEPYAAAAEAVEADEVLEPGGAVVRRAEPAGGGGDRRAAQWLRVCVTDARGGGVKLESRFPAGFLGGVAALIPQVAGMDLEGLLRGNNAGGSGGARPGAPVLEFGGENGEDRVEVFLE